jgi:hypothetical protein
MSADFQDKKIKAKLIGFIRTSFRILESKRKSSFRATLAKARGDPESSPAKAGIQKILDSGLRRNDGKGDFAGGSSFEQNPSAFSVKICALIFYWDSIGFKWSQLLCRF